MQTQKEMKSALLLFSLFIIYYSNSQVVIRGPYLQTPTESSIIIKWRTDVPTTSRVVYGSDVNNLNEQVLNNQATTEHTIELVGLATYSEYYYAVGDAQILLTVPSQDYRFKTHPLSGDKVPIRVWAIGDFGKGNAAQVEVKESYINYADTTHTDVWIWLGDNAYADGKDHEYDEKVFNVAGFSDVFSYMPYWPSPGNHDYNEVWQQSTLFGVPYSNIPLNQHQGPYYEIIDVPEQAEAGGHPSNYELFYSFDYGNVHFLSLNSELYDFTETYNGINQMKQWIEEDLLQNDQTFTIAYFHQPPYSKGSHDSDDLYERVMETMRERVIPLLEEYDIDLVVCGHSHVFERSHLIHGHYGLSNSFDPSTMLKDGSSGNFNDGVPYVKDNLAQTGDGTVYVVCGNSGSKTTASDLNHPVMYFSDGGDTQIGSFVVDVYRNRLDGKYLHASGQILDEFTIVKQDMSVEMDTVRICSTDEITIQPSILGGSDDLTINWASLGQLGLGATVTPLSEGSHTLIVTDNVSGQVISTPFEIIITPSISITLSNDTLLASPGFVDYIWYFNGVVMNNETAGYVVPQESGVYSVGTTNNACLSDGFNYQSTLSLTSNNQNSTLVFPNPSSGEVTIIVNEKAPTLYQITNSLGQLCADGILFEQVNKLNLNHLKKGAYNFMFIQKNHKSFTSLIIQ